ncbi:MAG: hypothetical protein ACKO85_04785 [Isosphaeraceae bacterium]
MSQLLAGVVVPKSVKREAPNESIMKQQWVARYAVSMIDMECGVCKAQHRS